MVLFADLRAMSEAYGLIHSIQNDIKLFGSASRKAGERETLDSLLEQEIRSRRRFGNRRSSGGGPIESLKTETAGAVQFLARTAGITEVEKATALADKVVLGSLAASTLIAIMLFAYFMRSINTGVNVVVENTDRFKRGEELKPPVENGDELAQVDAALYEMAQEIREAERTKQTIVATIAHDLRTPLTTVLGYFTLLASGALGDVPPAAISVAEKCERDVEELIRLINDLLDLEKIEAGKLSLRPKMLPVKQVIARAISNVLPFAEEKGVIVQGGDSSAEIYADPDRIVQALGNLLSSAVKLSPDGSLVDASAVPHNGEVEVRVTSSGVSTPGDLLNTQFDRYHQREHGLRLELPISKELIKLHGGTIGAISENNRCTFWCRLPSTMPTQQAA
jgi:signal transduction histidine kinase